jgi:hypothetical protein
MEGISERYGMDSRVGNEWIQGEGRKGFFPLSTTGDRAAESYLGNKLNIRNTYPGYWINAYSI